MNDLISRQAAIANAISGRTREIDGEKWIRVSEVRESIKTLPPAEPEIRRCEDCAHYNWDYIDVPYGLTKMMCWCDKHYDSGAENLEVNPDDYCKWAERKTDG